MLDEPDKKLAQALEAKRRVDVLEGKYLVIAKETTQGTCLHRHKR